jgi:predicted SAM-dependent methyltransferase
MKTVDRETWARQIGLCNFVNAYYQLRDMLRFPRAKRVLIIGPGQGLDPVVQRWRGYEVTTFDVDATFSPDVLGSVQNMHMFRDGEFDVAIASHVLEHLPFDRLGEALAEIARVAGNALIYLPVNGLSLQFRISTNYRDWDWSRIIDLRKWWRAPDPKEPHYMSGEHYWEIGLRGCSRREVECEMARHFDLQHAYRNHDWRPSMNFVLTSRRSGDLPNAR